MSNSGLSKAVLFNFAALILIFQFSPGNAYPFTSAEEYLAHKKGESRCVTQQCHAEFARKEGKNLHHPIVTGECSACHSAESYPDKYGLKQNQRPTCAQCHKRTEDEIQSSTSIHGPIRNGDCTSCHDPHESVWPFLLKKSYNKLCLTCHKPQRLYSGAIKHKPVKDGYCGLCHDSHASNFEHRLIDVGVNLCFVCHEDMLEGMTRKYIHTPILKTGCSGCHGSHAGKNKALLKVTTGELCFTCHEEKRKEVNQYARKHKPALEGRCITCHSPHYSEMKYLLRDEIDTLCYNCHKDNAVWKEKQFQHGPVVQGNCTACHNPHGSDNAFILRSPFPHKFYTEYEKDKYSLCFLCHKEPLVTVEETETITNFRNGTFNLHKLHVHKKKGRSCRACHDVHASDQEGRIRDEFPFGNMKIELQYSKTETGGSCISGCHVETKYDRVNKVKYEAGK